MNKKKHTIGLSMIMKDEAHVILRCLESIYKHIDYYCVYDTGSTDGCDEMVKDFFKEKKIPGKVIKGYWDDNFSRARNITLREIEKNCQWGIWQDCDEEFIPNENFNLKSQLNPQASSIAIETIYADLKYVRKNIWQTGLGFKWNGPIHELLSSKKEGPAAILQNAYIQVRPDGNSWLGNVVDKYKHHAEVLSAYCETNSDPRWIYYTAQSYKDSQQLDKAIEWFEKRVENVDGYQEERYVAALTIGRIFQMQGKGFYECLNKFHQAHELDPTRGEAIRSIIWLCAQHQKWELMYMHTFYGLRYLGILPPNRALYLETDFYAYEELEQHSYASFYTGRTDEGIRAYWGLRSSIDISKIETSVQQRILLNEQYFPKPKEIENIFKAPASKESNQEARVDIRIPRNMRRQTEREAKKKTNGK